MSEKKPALKKSLSLISMISIASGAVIGGWLAEAPTWFGMTGAGAALIFPLLALCLIPVGLMAVCMYLQDYFKALANVLVPPVQLFPIFRAGGLILSATMSALFFKEKITVRCVIGLVLAFVAIMLLK